MARRPPVSNSDLYKIATYLARPEIETEIHAELPHGHRKRFEKEYRDATKGHSLPRISRKGPYYVWPEGANKYGRELRIYFKRVPPEPPPIKTLYTDFGKWFARQSCFRINHSNLVMQLFECGFILGPNKDNQQRIEEFMRQKFPVK